ncbi:MULTISPECIES: glutaminyl-peptide cyclotransferase [unclassified Carboxylicivirga]|uniref:glutaminyl-peptide cyclotransferase n=1 Tax=Carboxylicivirga TaxID=1628153 RepID=UPI003D330521
MHKWILLIGALRLLCSCGIYLEHPSAGLSPAWKTVASSDSLVYLLPPGMAVLDSVVHVASGRVYQGGDSGAFILPAALLKPGSNTLELIFYAGGKVRKSQEVIYLVSDISPRQYSIDHFTRLPHDEEAFTQGLVWWKGYLFESTGLVGASSLRKIDPGSGAILQQHDLDPTIFAEGLTVYDDHLILLTWKDSVAYGFDLNLQQQWVQPYEEEGWGLTTAGDSSLMATNGSHHLLHLSPTLKHRKSTDVYNHRGPVLYLNELEYINGLVWANVLGDDTIVVVDPQTGKVRMEVDVSACINREQYPRAGVLNGIAYDPLRSLVYLTGKNWPFIIVWKAQIFDN